MIFKNVISDDEESWRENIGRQSDRGKSDFNDVCCFKCDGKSRFIKRFEVGSKLEKKAIVFKKLESF